MQQLSRKAKKRLFGIAIIAFIVLVASLAKDQVAAYGLYMTGGKAEAQIDSSYSANEDGQVKYHSLYSFRVDNSTYFSDSKSPGKAYDKGETVNVLYDQKDPSSSMIVSEAQKNRQLIQLGIFIAVLLVLVILYTRIKK